MIDFTLGDRVPADKHLITTTAVDNGTAWDRAVDEDGWDANRAEVEAWLDEAQHRAERTAYDLSH